MVNPGGTGRPMFVISPRLAPFPPRRSFMSLLPSLKSKTYFVRVSVATARLQPAVEMRVDGQSTGAAPVPSDDGICWRPEPDRGLRADRRLPLGRPGGHGRLDRLGVLPEVRLPRRLRQDPGRGARRSILHRPRRARDRLAL